MKKEASGNGSTLTGRDGDALGRSEIVARGTVVSLCRGSCIRRGWDGADIIVICWIGAVDGISRHV